VAKFAAKLTTTAGSTTLPVCALIGGTGSTLRVTEVWVFNTSTTAVTLQFCRISGATAGTPGASATSRLLDGTDTNTPVGVLKNTYSVAPTVITDMGVAFVLGAAQGSGLMIPFPEEEARVPAVANAGIGLLVDAGTGQAIVTTWKWKE
jgi:hypothetical protein